MRRCVFHRNKPAGPDGAGQEALEFGRDRGGHLQQTGRHGAEEGVDGGHSDEGVYTDDG